MQANNPKHPHITYHLLPFILVWCVIAACTPSYLSEEELKTYVLEQEELSKTRKYKGFTTQVTYRPTDLLIAQELRGSGATGQAGFERLEKKYADYHYFIVSLSSGNKEALYRTGAGFDQFSDLVQTLSFRMGEYMNMTTSGSDTIEVADYIFPRTYGMGGATNLMFVFNKKDTQDDEWIQLNLKEFGLGTGNQAFRFRKKDLEDIPRIKFTVRSSNE